MTVTKATDVKLKKNPEQLNWHYALARFDKGICGNSEVQIYIGVGVRCKGES